MRVASLLPLLAVTPVVTATFNVDENQLTSRDLVAIERSIQARGLANDIWNKIKNAATCTGCQGILLLLKGLAALGDGAFVGVVQDICKLAKVQDADVCTGAVALEGPIIARAIRDMKLGSRTSKLFCNSLLGLCADPGIAQWSVPFPSPKPAGGRPSPSGQTPLKIVHFSDIHIDEHYTPGSNTQCNKPICCRAYTKDDAPGVTKNPAGPNGDHKCDSPLSLEESMYKAIADLVPDAAFNVFTGDIVDHTIWNTSIPSNTDAINNAYGLMETHLGTVYGTIGNHEQSPVNGFMTNAMGTNAQWLYNLAAGLWSGWTGPSATDNVKKIGAYSVKHPERNIRVISLNTNMYYKLNFFLYQKNMEQDPNGQLAWLVKELDAAEKAGENVYIIGHMPMGDSDAFRDGSNYFDQIVNRYSNTIAALFFGHTHVDHFEISYSDYSKRTFANAKAMSYICPSLTPTSGMPSFRVYDVDPVTFGVLDSTTYIADMTDAAFQTTGPVWKKYYSAKEAYGAVLQPPVTDANAELTPAFWHNVTVAFEQDQTLFDTYIAHKSRGWQPGSCTGDCKTNEICQLRAARGQDNCFVAKPGFNIAKRGAESDDSGKHDECGTSVGMAAFASLVQDKSVLDFLQAKFNELGATLEDDINGLDDLQMDE